MKIKPLLLFFMLTCLNLCALSEKDKSKALGYLIGKNIQSGKIKLNFNSFIEGLNSKNKLEEPLDENYLHLIDALDDFIKNEKKQLNLVIANQFLEKNKELPDVIEVIPGKAQYKKIYEGSGEKVSIENAPLITYKIMTLDDKLICDIEESQMPSLFEIESAFSKSILGMRENEIRIIYLHPDCSILKNSEFENSLIKIEARLIKYHQNFEIDKSFISKQGFLR